MDSVDLGLLVMSVMLLALAGGVHALSRLFSRDQIFDGVVPGQVPGPGQEPHIKRVSPGREYSGEVAVQFQPPRGLTPGLVGTVVDSKADMHDVTATIVDLAVRDYVKIASVDEEELPAAPRGRRQSARRDQAKDWVITKLPRGSRRGDVPLHPFEQRLLRELFRDGDTVRMSQLGARFADTMRGAQADLYEAVQAMGWYKKHPQASSGGCLGTLLMGASALLALLWVFAGGFSVISILSAVVVLGAGWLFNRSVKRRVPRTAVGTAAYIQTLGFKKYLATAEADQIKFEEAAEIFSRYLPYAIVFGVADHWAKVFGEVAAKARLEGYDVPMALDWFDGLYMGMVVADLLDGVGGTMGMLEMVGDLDVLDALGGAVEGFSGLAEGVGDFISGIDFDF
ncbi:DUF2207 domain-containing protein [Propionibacteriaceae bacterium Y1923]|uniref:DUF2207 domain-containing protein n=1 Tax=Aestuariimicrobium sp. Y1814 TaxID=3418742 RepID=UPI003C186CFB